MEISINNHRYDPNRDTLIASIKTENLEYRDFKYLQERLFVNRGGYFYLERDGGVDARCYGDWGGGQDRYGYRIIPMTEQEAENWKKAHPNAVYA